MRFSIIAFFLAAVGPLAGVVADRTQPTEWEQLQGTWTHVATETNGKVKSGLADPYTLIVKRETVSLMHGDRLMWEGSIRQAPGGATDPVKYDLVFDLTKGEVMAFCHGDSYGILQIRGDEHKMSAAAGLNNLVRPKGFDSKSHYVSTWHRKP